MAERPPDKNTYFLDAESPTEMTRLIDLHRFATKAMDGLLVGVSDPHTLHNVLDLGCGPGGWVLDVAFAYPHVEVAGVDISTIMVDYANARARSQGLTNASFGVMDITKTLDFADGSFDLVNARFLWLALRKDDWAPFIAECTRLLRPGGVLCLTEFINHYATSAAHERLHLLLYQALSRGGYGFSPGGHSSGVAVVLPRLLRLAGYKNIQYGAHVVEHSAGTEPWADHYHDFLATTQLGLPSLVKAGVVEQEEAERLRQQAIIDMHAEDFCAMFHFMSVWGYKP